MATASDDYELLDSGGGNKLERFGPHRLARPCASAVWEPALPAAEWQAAQAQFARDGGNAWTFRAPLPPSWTIAVEGISFQLSATAFGHLGVFPEQRDSWRWIADRLRLARDRGIARPSVLNLFAYTGGATVAAARAGAEVCHLDASRGMVARARENASRNGLEKAPIRWMVEDVTRFLGRERRRGNRYDALVLDPPSFGRGRSGEVYKIESDLTHTLGQCDALLSERPLFVLLSCHTPAFTPLVLHNLLRRTIGRRGGRVECGELLLRGRPDVLPLPSGTYAAWTPAP